MKIRHTETKHYTKITLLIAFLFLGNLHAMSQSSDEQTYTPYELLSSYYSSGNFSPFSKKNWYTGLAFSLNDEQSENTTGLIQDIINGENLNYNLTVKGGYYSKDYNMIGLNFSYYQKGFNGTVFQDPDTIQSNSLTRGYSFTPNLRSSIPLTKNQRLSFFVELDLVFGYATTLSRNTKYVDEISKTYTTEYTFGAGVSPGITFFAMEAFAFEIQLNVVGYKLDISDSEINGEEQSRVVNQKLNMDIDLLTLDLGLAYYFGANKKK